MAWKVTYEETGGIVESVFSGNVTFIEVQDALRARVSTAQEKGSDRFIIDADGIESVTVTVTDTQTLVTKMWERVGADMSAAMALLCGNNRPARSLIEFLGTASFNRGWTVKIFEDRDNAVAWLAEFDGAREEPA